MYEREGNKTFRSVEENQKGFTNAFYGCEIKRRENFLVCIGNSMICSDIWHKYHASFFDILIRNFTSR